MTGRRGSRGILVGVGRAQRLPGVSRLRRRRTVASSSGGVAGRGVPADRSSAPRSRSGRRRRRRPRRRARPGSVVSAVARPSPVRASVGASGGPARDGRRRLGTRAGRRRPAAVGRAAGGRVGRPSGSRWATASNSRIEPATAALSEPTAPRIGIRIEQVAAAPDGRPEPLALAADDDRQRAAQVGSGGRSAARPPRSRRSAGRGRAGRPARRRGRRPGRAAGARRRRPRP